MIFPHTKIDLTFKTKLSQKQVLEEKLLINKQVDDFNKNKSNFVSLSLYYTFSGVNFYIRSY